ncbi:probable multidrug resistance-associated protein lethal(2)03659 isoform X1 [Stomoxys calcitrans]|uniref:probable multidrug resistance-associated protein lethal(2)03659 isoform X1 n=1 Tax=Stomoxys calcitrans TaxID=35570 RepID=UPI0027E314D8|nr:probable multidrug resistance-associated protein lethal(2)03659 isoform X1 [Stomoxys calcitrans]
MQSFKADELPENPRESSNPLSSLMFCFVMPTFFKGRKKVLEETDLYRALKEHKSDFLGHKLSEAWEEECNKKQMKHKEPSLLKACMRVFGLRFATLGFILFILEIGLRVTQPLFLGGLVSYYAKPQNNNSSDLSTAYLYAMGVILCSAVNVLLMHPYMLGILHVGMKIRVAMCSMIYRKALRLSKTALGNTTSGQVVNLISNDVGRLDTSVIHMHYLWLGPVEIVIITYLMYREIGVSSLFGVAIMILFLPLQAYLGKMTSVLRLRTALRTDERVRMMNEIISGIQVIKMYAWEKPFGKMVQYARRKEMNAIRLVNYIRGILQSFIMFLTRISVFASLVGFVLLGKLLTAEKAFVITAYYNILRTTMTVYFPMGISQFAETMVSFKRIQKYMMHEETKVKDKSQDVDCENNKLQPTAIIEENGKAMGMNGIIKPLSIIANHHNHHPHHLESGVTISKLKAKWDHQSTEYTLDNIDFKVKPRTLVAVIGPVGSGKSSLIQAILGELPAESGFVNVSGTLSYASQEPWLFTGTVRQNILFGMPMDRQRYRTVVKKCALERDFELLPYGDKTIVGERGASLSGGQKARINLARAVYRKADVYLLDDPLSAVDTHVGRHLFDQCMRGYLRDDIVLLVTHQLQFMEQADLIVIMDKGRISAIGTFESMRKSGLDFAKLLMQADSQEDTASVRGLNGDIGSEKQPLSRQNSKMRSRQDSVSSMGSVAESAPGDAPVQVQETREQGKIGLGLYKKYFGASGGYFQFSAMAFFCIAAQVLASGGDYFLSYWVNKNGQTQSRVTDAYRRPERRLDSDSDPVDLYIFSAINISVIFFALTRSLLFFNLAKRSSTNLHNTMFEGVTRASMYFFNTNPAGRILNRFAKDLGQVDELLPGVMMDVTQIFLALLGIVIVLCVVNPWYLVATALLSILFYFMRSFYLNTSRDVKRLEAVTRSPIYSHLGASLNGLSTIRAFGAQQVLIEEFDNYQDLHSSGYFMFLSTSRAFGYWLDCCCVLYIAIITLSFFLFSPKNGGDVGLAITQAMGMTGMVQWGMRQSAELENTMTAVERVVEYESLEPEGEMESPPNKKPPKSWPEEGQIIFDNLSLRYFPDPKAELVLKNLNISIKAREKIGIVGRTGAGKSSLINALFRLSYNNGSVIIDKRDTKEMGLYDLRSKISIIPQEPVLFSGTMRYNLDPFDEYSDVKLWKSLEEVKLKEVVSELPSGLQSKISEGGTNFSVGQRQLVCLARAILRENRILVMDEATANVDPQTDALIQTTIRNKFRHCTVLTIAHRLHTVMDSDKVLVMDAGRAVEFGSPFELLTQSKTNIFCGMVKQTGNATFESLLKVAQKAHEDNLKARKDS